MYAAPLLAQQHDAAVAHPPASAGDTSAGDTSAGDTGFRALQARGQQAMGVDQYTSTHHFDARPDGGRIVLERTTAEDSIGIKHIRAHLHAIALAFKAGDFSTPMFVHMRTIPGVQAMAAKRGVITYTVHDLPLGGEMQITTADSDAVHAIHEFLGFQRGEHHAAGAGATH